MGTTGSDFTDTFRILGKVKSDGSNKKTIVEELVEICAPLKLLTKKNQPKYSATEIKKIE